MISIKNVLVEKKWNNFLKWHMLPFIEEITLITLSISVFESPDWCNMILDCNACTWKWLRSVEANSWSCSRWGRGRRLSAARRRCHRRQTAPWGARKKTKFLHNFHSNNLIWSLQRPNKVSYASLHVNEWPPSPAQNALSPLDLLLQGGPHGQIVRRALPLPLPLGHLARHLQLCAANTHALASFVVTCSPLHPRALHVFCGGSRGKRST